MITRYRLLEDPTTAAPTPLGVAYEREGAIWLFVPPWRSERPLSSGSLEGLGEADLPAPALAWREVETCGRPVEHPIEILQCLVLPAKEPEAKKELAASKAIE